MIKTGKVSISQISRKLKEVKTSKNIKAKAISIEKGTYAQISKGSRVQETALLDTKKIRTFTQKMYEKVPILSSRFIWYRET